MKIRAYKVEDKNRLFELLQLNIPKYFAKEELDDFEEYLKNHLEYYFVLEDGGQIIGGGGINSTESQDIMRISWDFFHPKSQSKGYGSALLKFRIEEIRKMSGVKTIEVRTSQLAYLFYEKAGFKLVEIQKDFWAKDFDLYLMKKVI